MVNAVKERAAGRVGYQRAWSRSGGAAAPNPFVGRRSPVPTWLAVSVLCVIGFTAGAVALVFATAGRSSQVPIVLGSVAVLVLWGVLMLVPMWLRAGVRWLR